jgi:Raf kinase inhibitor-like YbhB/YbcL family protein
LTKIARAENEGRVDKSEVQNGRNMSQTQRQHLSTWLISLAMAAVLNLSCDGADKKGGPMITVTSEAFKSEAAIPKKFTEDGSDVSPSLRWQGVPDGTKELAIICDDPNAPTAEPWVHWVLYKISADVSELPEGVPADAEPKSPVGARQGKNSWKIGRNVGYRGPAPPKGHGVHHYHFRIYALDAPLSLAASADKRELLAAMKGHVWAEGELVGTYERK